MVEKCLVVKWFGIHFGPILKLQKEDGSLTLWITVILTGIQMIGLQPNVPNVRYIQRAGTVDRIRRTE